MHALHVVLVLHVSPLDPPHELESQTQSPQLPDVGPVDVPSAQSPAPVRHHPQPARTVHDAQSPSEHGSVVPPPHALCSQTQSAHAPDVGPVEVPG